MPVEEPEDDARPADVEGGSTAGRTHAQVLEQTLGRERANALGDGPPVARGDVVKERHREMRP